MSWRDDLSLLSREKYHVHLLWEVETTEEISQIVRASGVDEGPEALHGPVHLRLSRVAELVREHRPRVLDLVLTHRHLRDTQGTGHWDEW